MERSCYCNTLVKGGSIVRSLVSTVLKETLSIL